MALTIAQMASMSRLLDEALPLDVAARRVWLERLPPEYLDLAQHMRDALLSEDSQAAHSESPLMTSKPASAHEASAAIASCLQPGARVGPYELIRRVGAGGMAEVWLARRGDGAFKREVALKVPKLTHLRTYLEQRFARERDILASLEHPHIARFYDAGIDPHGLPYVAMEYVHGLPLTNWFEAHRLEIPARLELFLQVLVAVQYAHQKHVIHRDLKPSNILVTESGQVRLLDFGVAKLLEADEGQLTHLTNLYGRALTPDYASPELLRGDSVDTRSDIYSLGVLLYETLTGVRPYQLKSAASIGMLEQAIAGVDISKPSTRREQEEIVGRGTTPEKLTRQLRGDLDAITLKALAKAPAERYASAAALAEDLRRYLGGKPIKALPTRFTDRLHKFVRRNKTVVGITAAAVAAVVATIGYTLHLETVARGKTAAHADGVSAPGRATSQATASLMAPVAFAAPESSIAVLPFVDMSEKKDQEYFSDGLSEELIELLAKTPRLRVSARTSSFYFKGRAEKLETIAAELRVANVLEGSVRKSGKRLRVTAQLIRVDTSERLWSETFDRKLSDVFTVQDEIAGAVVSALKVKLTPAGQAPNLRRTSSPEAHNQYLLGRQLFERGNSADTRRAAEAYRKAIELDPNYAAAYAELAVSESFVADQTGDEARQQQALVAADKAVELAPEEVAAYAARGYLRLRRWDWTGSKADFEKALTLDSGNSSLQWQYAGLLDAFDRLPAAIAAAKKATELDPLSGAAWTILGAYLLEGRQFAAAHEAVRRALDIQPQDVVALNTLGYLLLLEGNAMEALAVFRQQSDEGLRLFGVVIAEHTLGHGKESQRALDEFIAKGAQGRAYGIANAYAWRGEKDKAFEWLDRAYQWHDSNLYCIRHEVSFASLRGDARFATLLRKMNMPE
jgi:serine/threonine protein kinase/TolB-like protein/Flp pilus assembly protein TadD